MEADRVARCEELGIDPGGPEKLHPGKVNTMVKAALEKNLSEGELVAIFADHYLRDDFGRIDSRTNTPRNPPWPIAFFFSANVFDKFRAKYDEADAA